MDIYKKFSFDSAHYLPNLPEDHKCKRMHGHTFNVEIHISGPIDKKIGWIMDFGDVKEVCDPVINQLDHIVLNEVPGLENPTSENLSKWIWKRLKPKLQYLTSIEVKETCSTGCIYRGENG